MIFRPTTLSFSVSAVVLAVVLWVQPEPVDRLPDASPATITPTPPAARLTFRDITLDWRIFPVHQQSAEHLSALTETLGSGVCVIDVNRDGWMDLFFVGGSGHTRHYGRKVWWLDVAGNRLFLNREGDHFEDVTAHAGLQVPQWGMGCAVADLDNDGFDDLVVTGVGGNRLFRNNGDATFTDLTAQSGITGNHWSTGASIADFDGDGLLDIYISNYILFHKGARTFERSSGFRTTTDVAFDPTLYDPEPNRLYRNRGNFRFEDVTARTGVANALGRTLGARWLDFNDDGWPDLFVVNDHDTPNQVFLNDGGHAFQRGDDRYASLEVAGAHDFVAADFGNDGRETFFMTRGAGHAPVMLEATDTPGGESYTDIAWLAGVARTELLPFSGWGAGAADFDNDGDTDLYVAQGGILPDMDSHFVPQAQPDTLLINDGGGRFLPRPVTASRHYPGSSRAVATVDLDNDGQLEVIVSHNNGPLQILAGKPTRNRWLTLEVPDRTAIDRLVLQAGAHTIVRRPRLPQQFLSQSDPRIHIGLGDISRIERITVQWRDGSQNTFSDIEPDRFYRLDRDSATLLAQRYPRHTATRLPDTLEAYDPRSLSWLARLLITYAPQQAVDRELLQIWRAAPAAVRHDLLKALAEKPETLPAPLLLNLTRRALADPDAGIRMTGVDILKDTEFEHGADWLIPLLHDTDSRVQCRVAEAFRFFFDEEEALTHRKMLAVSPLIRLLDAGPAPARACAANALAAAENKRAVRPLMLRARASGPDAPAAIRALGLIRDNQAVPLLREQLVAETASTESVAAALVALARLGVREQSVTPRAVLLSNTRAASERYRVLAHLFDLPDGPVFSPTRLSNILEALLENAPPDTTGSNERLLAALDAVRASGDPRFREMLAPLAVSADNEIAESALVALGALRLPDDGRFFETLLLEQPPARIRHVIQRLGEQRRAYSPDFLRALLKDPVTAPMATALLRQLPPRSASALLSRLLEPGLPDMALKRLFEVCVQAELAPGHIDMSLASHPDAAMRLQATECLLRAFSDNRLAHNIAVHRLVDAILSDPHQDATTGIRVQIMAARHNRLFARTRLAPALSRLPEQELPAALSALASTQTASDALPVLQDILDDTHHTLEVRLHAAYLIASTKPDERLLEQVYALFDRP